MKEQQESERMNASSQDSQIKLPLSQIDEKKQQPKEVEESDDDNMCANLNSSQTILKKVENNTQDFQLNSRQSQPYNKSSSSSLSEEHLKCEQYSSQSSCSSNQIANSCSENSQGQQLERVQKKYKQKQQDQSHMHQFQSSESCSSSCMHKIQNQMVDMNLSCDESPQNVIQPHHKIAFTKQSQVLQQSKLASSSSTTAAASNNQSGTNLSSNKFHFNKENYFDILVAQEDHEQLNVQTTIDKYNHYNEIQKSFEGGRRGGIKQESSHQQHQKGSSQDLLNLIFCQNQQSLPFSLNIPTSITQFWPKESFISTNKLDTIGLEKQINERFINSRKDSSSQNSSDNLTQNASNNEYSSSVTTQVNYNNKASSASASLSSSSCNTQLKDYQPLSFAKKASQVQPLTLSTQQNLVKIPNLWKFETATAFQDQKQNGQVASIQQRNIHEQSSSTPNRSILNLNRSRLSENHIDNQINQSYANIQNGNIGEINNEQYVPLSLKNGNIGNSNSNNGNNNSSNNGKSNIINGNNSTNNGKSNINGSKNRICNCKKTKCLKLYCDCFAVGELCGVDCKCVECCNNEISHTQRNQAIEAILERNPFAFNVKPDDSKKVKKEQVSHTIQNSATKVVGCNCRKSNCLKKYCLCYQSGIKCSELCKCTECKNLENGLNSSSTSFCSSSMLQQQNLTNSAGYIAHPSNQIHLNNSTYPNNSLYNQPLQQYPTNVLNSQLNSASRQNNQDTIQKIIDGLALQQQHQNSLIQNNPSQQFQDDYREEEENSHQNNQSFNNILFNAISQFNLKLPDTIGGIGAGNQLGSSPTYQNLQSQVTRKKLFLNNSGLSTPVSPGGLAIQNQQSHLNVQNINNIFSLIKNISTDQYQ